MTAWRMRPPATLSTSKVQSGGLAWIRFAAKLDDRGSGPGGRGSALDGTDDYVDIPPSDSLDINTNEVSISLWVKASRRPSALSENFGGIYDSVEDSYVVYFDRDNGELRFKITDANTHAARPGVPETAITTGLWHHVVGVFDGSAGPVSGQASIYLDGRLMDNHTGRDGGGGRGLTGNVRAGQHAAMGRNGSESVFWFPGIIDDVAIWRHARFRSAKCSRCLRRAGTVCRFRRAS